MVGPRAHQRAVNRESDLQLLLPLAPDMQFTVTLQLDMNQGLEPQLAGFYQHANDPAMVRHQAHAAWADRELGFEGARVWA